ncbi:hypothetical protein J6I90_05705 [Pseudidiomarina sp. 1APP75-32.1]|uniref:Uncharacterized protein n=2 Tax=Pseudidiomarina terrestris TaxID=2820060 RepID=A0AAW7QZS7_9GAMM|nr:MULTISPECIES: hypothetical protein [unclassified Pseudidiomarina]MDN7124368.1 hypothetical protein [Pseudidiomarina sp. 1APP75-32.1]MDN7136917.1 hypothetical protein [Pseudidiomarina sp. 1ASP75-14]
MKTAMMKSVHALSALAMFTLVNGMVSTSAIASVEVQNANKIIAQQVYRYTYAPENYAGSIDHELGIMQQTLMADVRKDSMLSARAGLETSANELRDMTRLAELSLNTSAERAPDHLFGRPSYTLRRSYQMYL